MKKTRWAVLAAVTALALFASVASAASGLSDVEQKWLDFQRTLKGAQVKDGVMTQEEADTYLRDLENKLRQSETDIVQEYFKRCGKAESRFLQGMFAQEYAALTNRSLEDVKKSLRDNKMNVFELAQKEGNLDKLKGAIVKKVADRLSGLVKSNKMAQAEMDEKLKKLQGLLDRCLENKSESE